jgi:hypothetical protein
LIIRDNKIKFENAVAKIVRKINKKFTKNLVQILL